MRVERDVIYIILASLLLMVAIPWAAGMLSEEIFFDWPYF